jgi:uncharacterized protein YegP (UPF0339 family)
MARPYYIEVYKDATRRVARWRWRRIAGNGQYTDVPGQGYTRKASAVRSAHKAHPVDEIKFAP